MYIVSKLKAVNEFRYLGGLISSNCSIDADITSRIAKASATFGRLSRRQWNTWDVHLSTKLVVCKAAVTPVFLYNCETWTMYRRQIRQLDRFHMTCLRRNCEDQLERPGGKYRSARKVPNSWY